MALRVIVWAVMMPLVRSSPCVMQEGVQGISLGIWRRCNLNWFVQREMEAEKMSSASVSCRVICEGRAPGNCLCRRI